MDGHAIYAQKAMIFQYIFQFLQKHHRRTNGRTYPLNAIAASRKVIKKPRELSLALIPGPSRLSLKKHLEANSIFYLISNVHPGGLVGFLKATLMYNSSLAKGTDCDYVTPSFPWNNFDSYSEITRDSCISEQTNPSLSTCISGIRYHGITYPVSRISGISAKMYSIWLKKKSLK